MDGADSDLVQSLKEVFGNRHGLAESLCSDTGSHVDLWLQTLSIGCGQELTTGI